ncbi:MAG TPA: SOS response-associated peptidase [Tepidisphaeraceae bacterium]|nr:SOS response-associated peptidase [Tepidisphaeraceae bacterium]
MCGRYTLVRLADLGDLFPWITDDAPDAPPRYNIAPTQPVLAVSNDAPDRYDFFFWGLVPPWAKDTSVGSRMINARAETLAERPAFRNAYRRRRCLIPADGFYEWKKPPPGGKATAAKTPMYVRMRSREPFAFAGLWETWSAPDGSELRSCTIVTTSPNKLMAPMHDRMPVILPRDKFAAWLHEGERSPQELNPLLAPYPDEAMEAGPVSTLVNSPKNDLPDCIAPPDEEPPEEMPPPGESPTLFG